MIIFSKHSGYNRAGVRLYPLDALMPDAPPAPDYAGMAREQGEANKDAAIYNTQLNRVNQLTPYGNSTWQQAAAGADGSPGQWTQTVTLAPEQQALLDMQNQSSLAYGQAGLNGLAAATSALANPFDTSTLPALSGGISDSTRYTPQSVDTTAVLQGLRNGTQATTVQGAATSASGSGGKGYEATAGIAGPTSQVVADRPITSTFDRSGVRALPGTIDDTSRRRVEEALMSRINPQLQRDESALRNRLLNSGIEVGTNAYNREMTNFGQNVNDARMGAVLAGGQEESRQVGLLSGLQKQEYDQALATGNFAQAAQIQLAANALRASEANARNTADISMSNARNTTDASVATSRNKTDASVASARNATEASIASAEAATRASLENARMATETNRFNANATDTARRAAVDAVLDSMRLNNSASAQGFQQELAGAGFANQARQQGIEEQAFLRTQPLNELNALRSGSQVTGPQFGSYYTGGNAAAAPIMDAGLAAGNFAMQNYQNQQSGANALFGGLANLGGAAMMAPIGTFSDRRLKKNLIKLGQHPVGIPRYSWDWKDGSGSSYGVMAQDLLAVRPDAVVQMDGGWLGVNYSMIGGQ